jgi:CRP-like cAMP-binding protein
MMLALHSGREFSDLFVAHLLARDIRYQEVLFDHLFDTGEKRLARVLLLLAHFGDKSAHDTVIPKVCQKTLAAMAGTTRLSIHFFMQRFRKSGFLTHAGSGLQINSSLLNVFLND